MSASEVARLLQRYDDIEKAYLKSRDAGTPPAERDRRAWDLAVVAEELASSLRAALTPPDGPKHPPTVEDLQRWERDLRLVVSEIQVALGKYRPLSEAMDEIRKRLGLTPTPNIVAGYDATFWYESYSMLKDAVTGHLARFIVDSDVAEEAILVEAIEEAGAALRHQEDAK